MTRRRTLLRGENGFTLIELLVVILIIGILAAIAIPSFLNQRGKASDAAAKELAHTLQVAIESLATDNSGSYALATPAILQGYESTIQLGSGFGNAYVQNVNTTAGVTSTATTYTVTATSTGGHTFSINRSATGALTRTCTPVSQGGCSAAGSW